MKLIRAYFPLVLTASLIIALDQWTKWLAREYIPFGGQWLPDGLTWLMPYARLVHWYNTGVAFGLFQGYGWVSGVLALVVVGLIIYYYPRPEASEWWMRLALGMQAAGALGNLIDRLTLDGKVTDFISVGTFPVFNIADASITLGVGVLLLGVYLKERAEHRQTGEKSVAAEDKPGQESVVDAGVAQGE